MAPQPRQRQRDRIELSAGMQQWIAACRGGKQSPGNFLNAGPISEAVNLYAVALRARRRLVYANGKHHQCRRSEQVSLARIPQGMGAQHPHDDFKTSD